MTEEPEREEFHQEDLPLEGFPVMDQIRSEGRLCDIMLKVINYLWMFECLFLHLFFCYVLPYH